MKMVKVGAGLLVAGLMAGAQASTVTLDEGFDNFAGLVAAGWVFTNNSAPVGQSWFAGNSGIFPSHAGAADAYAGVNFLSASGGVGAIDNWLISPEFSLGAITTLDFYTKGADDLGFFDMLEVRFSSGSGSDAAGFTSLLQTIGDGVATAYPDDWTHYSLVLPSAITGRIAFRYVASDANNADYIGVDTVSVSATAVPEPTTIALVGLALAAVASMRRRRSATSAPLLV